MFGMDIMHRQAHAQAWSKLSSRISFYALPEKVIIRNSLSIQSKKEQIKTGNEKIDAKKN